MTTFHEKFVKDLKNRMLTEFSEVETEAVSMGPGFMKILEK